MKKFSRSLTDLINYLFSGAVVRLLPLLILPYAAAVLGERDFGLFALFRLYATLGAAIILAGIEQGLFRLVPSSSDQLREQYTGSALLFVLFSGLTTGAVYIFFSSFFQPLLFEAHPGFYPLFLPLIILLSALNSVVLARHSAEKNSRRFLLLNSTRSLVFVALFALGLLAGLGLSAFLYAFLFSEALLVLLSLPVIIRALKPGTRPGRMSEMLRIGFPLLGLMLATLLLYQSDHYIIKFILGVEQAGIYNYAYRFAAVISILVLLSNNVWMPRLFERGEEFLHEYLKDYSTLLMLICSALYFGLLITFNLLADTLIPRGFGQVRTVILIVGLGYLFYGHSQLLDGWLILKKKTTPLLLLFLIGLAMNIILNLVFIPRFGITAAATVTTVSFVFIWLALMVYLNRQFKEFALGGLLREFALLAFPALTVVITGRLWLGFILWLVSAVLLLLRNRLVRQLLTSFKG